MSPSPTIKVGYHECIVANTSKPCAVCGHDCHYVEICFEAYFCSALCINKMEADYWAAVYDAIPETWEEVNCGPLVRTD